MKTYFMFNNVFPKIVAIYEKMWKNIAVSEKPQMTIWRMLPAC